RGGWYFGLPDAHATRRLREAGAAPRRARRERVALGRGARAARAADRRRARARRPRAPRAAHALGSAPGRDEPVRRVPSAPYARDRSRGGGAGAARHLGGRLVNRPTNSGAKPSGQRASSQAPRSGAQRGGAERSRKGGLAVRDGEAGESWVAPLATAAWANAGEPRSGASLPTAHPNPPRRNRAARGSRRRDSPPRRAPRRYARRVAAAGAAATRAYPHSEPDGRAGAAFP